MKKIIILLMAVAFISSCSTSKKTVTVSNPAPIPPEGITFTQMENHKTFSSIQMPFEGKGFGKQDSYTKGPDGEAVYNPVIIYKGFHMTASGDIARTYNVDGDLSDINSVLEGLKKSFLLKRMLKKENVIEEYSDVTIGDKKCKRVYVSYLLSREDYSAVTYTLGYLFQNNETSAFFFIDKAKTSPGSLEEDLKLIDSVLKYMVETVEITGPKK